MKPFQYTKSWRSPADFPTVETDETQVREDMQCLFDEAAEAINNLIDAVNTGNSGGEGASCILPAATAETLGGVKVGEGLAVTADGMLSLDIPNGDEVKY